MINFTQPYIPHLSHHTAPLMKLLKKKPSYLFGGQHKHNIPEAENIQLQGPQHPTTVVPERFPHHCPGRCQQTQAGCLLTTTWQVYSLCLKVPDGCWNPVASIRWELLDNVYTYTYSIHTSLASPSQWKLTRSPWG